MRLEPTKKGSRMEPKNNGGGAAWGDGGRYQPARAWGGARVLARKGAEKSVMVESRQGSVTNPESQGERDKKDTRRVRFFMRV